ncbi:RNA-dependent ATPase rok1 [Tilletia horrida]|uniref:RNA helicase n=1 Tax=Tilletia horrida TaxID=155126 RepID=A0AAN6GHB4_9BASI|nr:RNA-dependent ATPase rok1 [Tilletia horrida]KAK0540999.1 RNA-dependent ATPase rok1 [Tilletia horrida]KAK0564890.1 RNA-dependent ATPase rok1 [Tilletia horrida]
MSAGHLFSTLTGGGVYFNKKKYASDLALFKNGEGSGAGTVDAGKSRDKKKGSKRSASTASSSKTTAPALALPAELDFFGSSAAPDVGSSSQPGKKRKRTADDDGDSDVSDGSDEEEEKAIATGSASPTDLAKDAAGGDKKASISTIHQRVLFVGSEEGKLHALRQLVLDGEMKPPVLLLVQSVQRAQDLYSELAYDNLRVDVIHQDRPPAQRKAVLERFRQGEVWVLIATDKVIKPLAKQSCNLVLSYDFPQSAQSYTDRIARTGRPGKEGKAVTLFTKEDRPYLKIVVNVMKISGTTDIPQWLLDLPNLTKKERRKLRRVAPERKDVKEAAGTSTFGRKEAMKRAEMVAGSKRRSARDQDRGPRRGTGAGTTASNQRESDGHEQDDTNNSE